MSSGNASLLFLCDRDIPHDPTMGPMMHLYFVLYLFFLVTPFSLLLQQKMFLWEAFPEERVQHVPCKGRLVCVKNF